MEEVQQEAKIPAGKHSSAPLVLATIFVVIYFLFPVVFIYPMHLVWGNDFPSRVQTANMIIFYPDLKLSEAIPAYHKMLDWEFSLLGI